MSIVEKTEARRQQARRRLAELEIAVHNSGGADITWHMTQAARSGASFAEVLDALRPGMETRDTSATDLTQSSEDMVKRVFNVRGASRPARQSMVEVPSPC